MSTQVLMPALSPTMSEGKLSKWLVKEGDVMECFEVKEVARSLESVDKKVG